MLRRHGSAQIYCQRLRALWDWGFIEANEIWKYKTVECVVSYGICQRPGSLMIIMADGGWQLLLLAWRSIEEMNKRFLITAYVQ